MKPYMRTVQEERAAKSWRKKPEERRREGKAGKQAYLKK